MDSRAIIERLIDQLPEEEGEEFATVYEENYPIETQEIWPKDGPRFRLFSWDNVPRYPPTDRWGVNRGYIMVKRAKYDLKLKSVFDYSWPATYWFLAKRFVGKSTGAEDIGIEYIECKNEHSQGGTVIDLFSSDDDEGAAWVRSGYWPILAIAGNKVDLEYSKRKYPHLDWCHIGELKHNDPEQAIASIKRFEKYKVVFTVPSFYFNPNEMFRALSSMIDLLKLRGKSRWTVKGKRKILCVIVREAKVLLASRYWSGAVHSRQDAEMDLIELNDGAYHTGIALAFDSLRFTSITPEVRDIADFTFLKRLGRMKIPKELHYIMRYKKPRYLRRMPKGEFVLYTDTDDIFTGTNAPVEWHVERGEGPLEQLKIKAVYNLEAEEPEAPPGPPGTPQPAQSELNKLKWKVSVAIHKEIVRLIDIEGISVRKTVEEIGLGEFKTKLSISTISDEMKAHRNGVCLCVLNRSSAVYHAEKGENDTE